MSTTIELQDVSPTASLRSHFHPDGSEYFHTITARDDDRGSVRLYFDTLNDAATWLQDALDKVQLAKAESANTQPAPVRRGCYADDPTDGFICTLPRGHDGDHQAHGPRTTDEFDGELLASWPRVEFVAVPL